MGKVARPRNFRYNRTMTSHYEQNIIDNLRRSCRLVDVEAQYTPIGWVIRGRRLAADGKPVVEGGAVIYSRAVYLRPASKRFLEAYLQAVAAGIIKTPVGRKGANAPSTVDA